MKAAAVLPDLIARGVLPNKDSLPVRHVLDVILDPDFVLALVLTALAGAFESPDITAYNQ